MIRPYISEDYRNQDQKKDFLDAQINGEEYFLKSYNLNNGTIVFRTVDINGFQTEKSEDVSFKDVSSYRDDIYPSMAIIEPSEDESINKFYLINPTIRISQKTLFTNGQLIIYKDEWPKNPGKFFAFSLAKSNETIKPDEKITGSLNFFLSNEDTIYEQRYMFNNDVRFNSLESTYEKVKDSFPSLQEIEQNHQLIMGN
jgi:hypothetical protein